MAEIADNPHPVRSALLRWGLRIAPALIVLGAILYGVWALYLEPMRRDKQRIEELERIVARLTVEERAAQIVVTKKTYDPARDRFVTSLRFIEVAANGDPIGEPKELTVEGDVAYFDALVIKFEDKYVEQGDKLRGKALLLFRRIFGEHQKPSDGYPLDAVGSCPAPYAAKEISDFERGLWTRFWDYAQDPAAAAKAGVRVAQGEAVYKRMEKDKLYVLKMRSTGELSLYVEDLPAVMRTQ